MIADAAGEAYNALRSLDEARSQGATVIMEPTTAGSIYLICPADHVRCDEATLRQLLLDLDQFGLERPRRRRLVLRANRSAHEDRRRYWRWCRAPGLWLHPRLEERHIRAAVEAVLVGSKSRI